MSKVTDFLEKKYVEENFDIDAMGMMGRVPPLCTQEEEINDEQADKQTNQNSSGEDVKQSNKTLSWSQTKK